MAQQSAYDDGGTKSAYGAKPKSSTTNLNDIENLKSFAESKGYKLKEKKPSLFVRAIDLMSRPLYASAGAAKAIVKGDEKILWEAWKGLKGEEKETYADVLKEAGVDNKIARGVVGFALDVALDPTTYFGGAVIKGAIGGVKVAGKGGLNLTRAFNPRLAAGIEVAGQTLKDALGNAFVHGHGTSAGLSDDVSKFYNKLGISTDDAIKKYNDVFKALPKEQHKEFAQTLLQHRKKISSLKDDIAKQGIPDKSARELAKNELNKLTPEFKTPEQAKFFQEKYTKLIDEMAESAGLPEAERFKAYFPSIDVERLKPVIGGRAVSISDESYKKLYQGLVEKELDKPIEALTRTNAKIVRDNLARTTLDDAVRMYGKTKEDIAKLPKAEQALYRVIKEKQFGKEVGYLKEADFNFINNYLYPELKSIDLLAKASGYDAFNKIFKTAVTSFFPAFHIRNAASGFIQNYQVFGARALDPTNIPSALAVMKGSDRMMKLGKWTGKASDLQKVLQERFGKTSRYVADLGQYIDEMTDGSYKVMSKLNPARIGDFIEMNQKANGLVIGLKQGKSIDEALKLAEAAGFNYQKLTKFESKVMRRLIPFYSFMRKNAELQAKTLINNPERILNQAKLANAFSNMFGQKVTEEDLKGVPPWALDGLGFKIKDNKYVASFGVPMEEFFNRVNNPLMSTLSSLNPLIKYPLESKLGFDFFRERKIIDLSQVSSTSGEKLMKAKQAGIMPEWLDQAINVKSYKDSEGKTQYTMSPKMLHVLRNLPTARFQNTFEKIFDKDLETANKFTALFTGGKVYDIDTEKQKYFTERDLKRDLEDWLLSIGEGKKFEQFYIPKEK